MTNSRKPYPSDVSDDEWTIVAPYLTLMEECAPQRQYPLRELFNGLRYVIRYGIAWRAMPNDLHLGRLFTNSLNAGLLQVAWKLLHRIFAPSSVWRLVEMLTRRRRLLIAEPCDLRRKAALARDMMARNASVVLKLHLAVDTLGHLLALHVTPASVDDRAAVARLAEAVQEATDDSVTLVYADQGYTGEKASSAARDQGIHLQVVKLP